MDGVGDFSPGGDLGVVPDPGSMGEAAGAGGGDECSFCYEEGSGVGGALSVVFFHERGWDAGG